MNDPCVKCIERDRCSKSGIDRCKKKSAFVRYKEKCKAIAERTVQIMEDAREKKVKQV